MVPPQAADPHLQNGTVAGTHAELVSLAAELERRDAAIARRERLTPVISRLEDLRAIARARPSQRPRELQLKFNTGMNRLGIAAADAGEVLRLCRRYGVSPQGLCTHFAHNPTIQEMRATSVRLYREILPRETGQDVGFHRSGAMRVTRNPDRMDEFAHVAGLSRFTGYELRLVTPAKIAELHPLALTDGLLGGIYGLAVLIPGIAVTVRRLHDTGRSGWWMLVSLIPFGGLVVLFFALQDSQGPNAWGQSPKALSAQPA